MNRACDGCTKCCEGWLVGSIQGKDMFPGRPCHFKSQNGCAIYAERPEDPCRTFNCEWIMNEDIPEWMKPSEINAIVHRRTWRDKEGNLRWYLSVVEAGEVLQSKVLSWILQYCLHKQIDVKYEIEGGANWIGSQEFVAHLSEK